MTNERDSLLSGLSATHRLLKSTGASPHHWRMHLNNLRVARAVLSHLVKELDVLISEAESAIADSVQADAAASQFCRAVPSYKS